METKQQTNKLDAPLTQADIPPNDLAAADSSTLWCAWDQAKEAWLDSKRRRSGGENTARAYSIAVRQFFEFASVPPWQVSPAIAQAWAQHLYKSLSPASVNLKLAALTSLYDFVQRKYITGSAFALWPADRANPFRVVERARVSPYGRACFPSTNELKTLLSIINMKSLTGKRDFALLYTFATTCRRFSEIINLRWGDLQEMDDGDRVFTYRYKGGEERRAVLNRRAFRAICEYLQAAGRLETIQAEDYIFTPLFPERTTRLHPDRAIDPARPLSNSQVNAILKKYARRAGVDQRKAHVHALRHAGARLRVEQQKRSQGGVDYLKLMRLLGHSSLAVTQIYSQSVLENPVDPDGEAAAEELLPKSFF